MFDALGHLLQDVQGWVLALAASAWVYPVVLASCTIDGFFPPIPSESVVVALVVTAVAAGAPNLWLLLAAAALGAWIGDQVAYLVGRRVGTDRVALMRTARGRRTVERARHALGRRGATVILAARYVPVGRVAVNMSAGALGYSYRRYLGVSAAGAVTWAGTSTVVGVAAHAWFGGSPLLATGVGVAVGLVLGLVLDLVQTCVSARSDARVIERMPVVPAGVSERRVDVRV